MIMKKVTVLTLCSVFLFCMSCVDIKMTKGKLLEASKTITEKELTMSSFDKVDIDVVGHVKVVQSVAGDYRVVLSAPENYMDFFECEVNDQELEVEYDSHMPNFTLEDRDIHITIYTPSLRELENSGVATVVVDSLKSRLLKVENSGVGGIKMRGLHTEKLAVDCSGVGGITLHGVTTWLNLECSGVGSIDASGMKARRVKGEVSGVGGIECYASDTLKATVSGVGSLKYAGNPGVKKLNESGVGKISEL